TTTTTTTTTTTPTGTTTTAAMGTTETGKGGATTTPPKLGSLGSSATLAKIEKGLSEALTRIKARSKVTLVIRFGHKKLGTFTATASAGGRTTVRFHLAKRVAAKYKRKKLTLSFTVKGADGKSHTLTKTLKLF
ncbi:MAG TPA: hypothetical protein VHU61_19020, partial [Solirubrobacteraceae bacterium]|nr:hypothetical protein [Solirubrobacteraceae bacterium]